MTRDALGILFALKAGVAPASGIHEVTVLEREVYKRLTGSFEKVERNGRSHLDVVIGEYGEGKTHFLELLRQAALSRGHAVAKVTADYSTTLLSRPRLVLQRISTNLELPGLPTRGVVPLVRNLVADRGFTATAERLFDLWDTPRSRAWGSPLWNWPAAFYSAVHRPESSELVARWVSGDPVVAASVRQALWETMRPPSRIAITHADVLDVLKGLAKTVVHLGYRGLVLLVDEVENALSGLSTALQRGKSASFLHGLATNYAPLYVVAAATPGTRLTVAADAAYPYPQYETACRYIRQGFFASNAVEIEGLGTRQRKQLARKLVALHGEAFSWDAQQYFPEEEQTRSARAEDASASTRRYVKRIVTLLELSQQYRTPVAELQHA